MNYEIFHKDTSAQNKLIGKKDFTYRTLVPYVDKYLASNKKVLDIGSGAGTLCFYFANKSKKIVGIDISEKAVTASIQSAKALNLHNVFFEKMNFPAEAPLEKFDFIIFTEVIEHLKEDKIALKVINRLLNRNGILYLSTPSVNAPLHRIGYTKRFDRRVGHLRRYEPDKLVKMVEDAGFKIIEVKKNEGVVRNFLFLNPVAGKLIRFTKSYLSDLVTAIDDLTIRLFGESDIVIVARKV